MSTSAAAERASHAAGVLVLGNVLATLADIVVPLLIVRLLGKADVATLTALLLIYNTAALVVATGFPQAVMYHLPGRPRAERGAVARKIAGSMLVLGIAAGVLLVLLGLYGRSLLDAISPVDGDDVVDLSPLLLIALVPLGDLPGRILPNLLVAEDRPRSAAAYGVFRSLGLSLCTLLPLTLGGSVWTVAQCLVALGVAQGIWVLLSLRSLYGRAPRVPSPVSLGEMIRFGLPLGLTDVVAILNNSFDRFLIMLTFADVIFAEYQAGAWQIPIITRVPYVVGTAMAPQLVEMFRAGRPRDAIALWRGSIEKVSLLVVPIALVFVVAAEEVVEILFTAEYAGAAPVLRWYSILTVGRVAAFGSVIVAAGRPKYVFQASVLSLLSNVVLSVPLLVVLGFVGPAMGTALAFVPIAIFYTWTIGRASGLPTGDIFPLRAYAKVVAVALVGGAGALALKLSVEGSAALMLLGEAAVLLAVFAVLGTALRIIQPEDWRYIKAWLRLEPLTRRSPPRDDD
ncbi:MAG: oligosaccharide flippase family protein [Myxococcales bacterium]|nr:oligosaccharide flippase family protein [Myxococcales bacterium]